MNEFRCSVTGKQVLRDAVTLAKDTGIYVVSLGVRAVRKIRQLIKNADKKTDGKPGAEADLKPVSA